MTNMKSVISAMFKTALRTAYPAHVINTTLVQHSGGERFGDYKCTAAMPLSQVGGVIIN